MRHSIIHSVSKNNAGKALLLGAMAIVACGLLIGCPEPETGSPNLAITAVLTSASVAIGQTATVTVTVTNSGTAASSATMATLYRSEDATITTSDTRVGNAVAIPSIAAKATQTVMFTIPASETGTVGVLRYGACIAGSGAAICSEAVTLTVATVAPNIAVTALLPSASVAIGQTATVTVTVTNSGATASSATMATLYRSEDATITTSDTKIGNAVAIPSVVANAPQTVMFTIPDSETGTVGTFRYGACIAGSGAAICSEAVTLTVTTVTGIPNLAIVSLTSANTVTAAGGAFMTNVTVQNLGAARATHTRISFALVDDMGTVVKHLTPTLPVPALINRGLFNNTRLRGIITVPADTADGSYRLRATVSAAAGETNIADNTLLLGGNVIISNTPAPDLDVNGMTARLNASRYTAGTSATASVTVTNRGNANSTGGTVTFYRQAGGSPNPTTDTSVGTATLFAISSFESGRNTAEATATIDTGAVGTARYYAVVSGVTGDNNATNDISVPSIPVTIIPPVPDLNVSGAQTTISGAAPYTTGDTETLSVRVTNNGTKGSTDGTVTFYRGAVGFGTAVGTPFTLGTIDHTGTNTATATTSITLSSADIGIGVQYYAVVSGVTDETNTANNTSRPSTGITINAPIPDLEITAFTTTTTTLSAGDMLSASITVRNSGNADVGATTATIELLDSSGAVSGSSLGSIPISALNAGTMTTASGMIPIPADTPAGTYRLRATVPTASGETDTANNTRDLASTFVIPAGSLEITAFTAGGITSLTAGGTFTATVTVDNTGGARTAATTASFVLVSTSGGTNVTLTDTVSIDAIDAGGDDTGTGTINIPDTAGAGTYNLRATVGTDTFLLGGGTATDITIPAGSLEITIITVTTTTVSQGGMFDATITVENTGGARTSADTVSFALVPSSGPDIALTGTVSIGILNAGANDMETGTITVPGTVAAGTYNLRVTVGSDTVTFGGDVTPAPFTVTP